MRKLSDGSSSRKPRGLIFSLHKRSASVKVEAYKQTAAQGIGSPPIQGGLNRREFLRMALAVLVLSGNAFLVPQHNRRAEEGMLHF